MNPEKVIVRFDVCAEQSEGVVKRVIGFVKAKNMISLFDAADLDANPRSAKSGPVTNDIMDSIEFSPSLFPFKTKGVLVAASHYTPLQRQRYELHFEDTNTEGILDGGHNMLAIGTYILKQAVGEKKEISQIREWFGFKEAWKNNRTAVDQIKEDLNFLIPLELILPSDLEDPEVTEEFNMNLLDICSARNNNVQLTLEAKANKKGFYDEIRKVLPPAISKRVEWKTNDGGDIKVRDLISLAWIPLNKLSEENLLPENLSVSPQNIYRNKGECTKVFDKLMEDENISKPQGGYTHELHNSAVESAFKILADLPKLYDLIYERFPEAYNATENRRFGRNPIVRIYEAGRVDDRDQKYMKRPPHTKFYKKEVRYNYPDGLIMPLIYGLIALLKVEDKTIKWKTDPEQFVRRHLEDLLIGYKLVIDMSGFDPQKISKNETSYKIAIGEYEKILLRKAIK